VYAQGLTSAVPAITAGWNYSILYTAALGGPTAVTYAHGANLQAYHNTTRIPSVTLTDVGYYTDDGAFYYVWEAFSIPARPWPAEEGLLLVKDDLYERGVPIAYMQLDDWCEYNCSKTESRTTSAAPPLRHTPSSSSLCAQGTKAIFISAT
jgi:hypothetical protein